ncbi:Release factor glutamine methyltransferase [uncultured archaeon]|nr:Release factor glutamine methyltransferase [uncultured archaeon]
MVYEPQEDSFLLKEFVKRFAKGVVLDMGTGSGLQAREAAHSQRTSKVFAVDVDKKSIAFAKKSADHKHHKKVTWLVGDLFKPFKSKKYLHFFDTIIFNPPYLPQDHKVRDITLEGGRRGHETIERFLNDVNNYLKPDGIILLVFSSLTPEVHNILQSHLLISKELGKIHLFFEDIFVCLLKRSPVLNQLEKKGVCNIKFFAKGKRGLVFTGSYKNKKVAIKIKHPESTARLTIVKETSMLKELNKHGLGPKYLFHSPHFLVYEFVEGKYLKNYLKAKNIKLICKKVFEQCFQLDLLHVNKDEMTRPFKHIIIKGNKVTLIDFERARKVEEAHNVTQFCEFVCNTFFKRKKKEWIELAKTYSHNPSRQNFQKILAKLN